MRHTILIVDDEESNLSLFKMVLGNEYDITVCSDPREAKQEIDNKEFSIIISDQRMPHITGVELLTYAKEKRPQTIRILMSGFKDLADTINAINIARVYRYFQKPWNKQEIIKVLREAADEYEFMKKLINE